MKGGTPTKGGAAPARPPVAKTPVKSIPPKSSFANVDLGPSVTDKPSSSGGRPGKLAEKADSEQAPPAADDDPFAVDQSVAASALPVSRLQTPGKSIEVKCPMCETTGYISVKAAGKLVKCCNPECMVPTFTAPAIKKEAPPVPPPPKKKLPVLYILLGVAAAAIVGASIWLNKQTGVNDLPPDPNLANLKFGGDASKSSGQDDAAQNDAAARAAAEKSRIPTDGDEAQTKIRNELAKDALQRLPELAQNVKNNRKSQWRRFAATAYVHAGDLKHAEEQLLLLAKKSEPNPSYAVFPLAALAWQKAAASPEEFQAAVARVQLLADKIPTRGRYAIEAAVVMAPLLVISDKTSDARQLLAGHRSTKSALDQLAAELPVVIHNQTFDLDTTLPGRTIGDWQAPLESAVTLILIQNGRWDDALAWASQTTDPVAKAEVTTIWAESYLRLAVPSGDTSGSERAKKTAEGLSREGQARLLARLADVKLSTNDRPGAEELIAEAQAALNSIARPTAVVVHGIKPLIDLKLHDPVLYRQSALAAVEIARVQMRLGKSDAAWDNILIGLKFLHGIAPSSSAMRERLTQSDKKIDDEIKSTMGIKKPDDIRLIRTRYKEKCRDVATATAIRFFWQSVVFEAAAEFGLLDRVWDELQKVDRKPSEEREPFLDSALPMLVAARFAATGNDKKRDAIYTAIASRVSDTDPEVVKRVSENQFYIGDYADCIRRLDAAMTAEGVLHEWTLRLACRLVNQGKYSQAIEFCSKIKDTALSEDGLFLTAALAARLGHGDEFWKAASNLKAIEATAVCSGLVVGLKAQHP